MSKLHANKMTTDHCRFMIRDLEEHQKISQSELIVCNERDKKLRDEITRLIFRAGLDKSVKKEIITLTKRLEKAVENKACSFTSDYDRQISRFASSNLNMIMDTIINYDCVKCKTTNNILSKMGLAKHNLLQFTLIVNQRDDASRKIVNKNTQCKTEAEEEDEYLRSRNCKQTAVISDEDW